MRGIPAAGPLRRRACMLNGSMAAARMLKVGLLILRLPGGARLRVAHAGAPPAPGDTVALAWGASSVVPLFA
jgi:hypothetical protein